MGILTVAIIKIIGLKLDDEKPIDFLLSYDSDESCMDPISKLYSV